MDRVQLRCFAAGTRTLAGCVSLLALRTGRPVTTQLIERLPATFELAAAAMIVAVCFAIPLGIAAAVRRGTAVDHAAMTVALAGVSVPNFWLGPLLALVFAVLFLVHPARAEARSHGSLLSNFTDSLRYIRGNEVFARVITAALLNATLAMGYIHMLPVFAKDVLEVDSRGLGILTSAAGIGAMAGLLSYAWLQSRVSPRNLMVGSLTAYGAGLIGLAFSDWFWLSFCMILVAGLCHGYFLTCVQVIIQTLVQDHYRGRVMSVFTLVWGLIFFSGFLLNGAGSLVGPRLALAGGAAIVLAYAWLSLARATALRKLALEPKAG